MIVEERIYVCQAGKTGLYLTIYEEEVLPIQLPFLGHMIGYFTTDCGPLNQVVHMWGFASMEDRSARRTRLAGDERWHLAVAKLHPLILTMENKILMPAPFSPIGGTQPAMTGGSA